MATEGDVEGEEVEPLAWWTYVGVGALWYASTLALDLGGIEGEAPYLLVAAAFIGTFGLACYLNGRRCGALHCRVSGPGYLAVAALAVASAAGLVGVGQNAIMALFAAVFVGSYLLEFAVDRGAEPAS